MKKQNEQQIFYEAHSGIKSAAPIVVIIVLLAVVLAALMLNTAQMHATLRQNTVDYANDVSAQLAGNISHRIQTHGIYINNLADTFSRMPEFLMTEDLLKRKAEYLKLDDVFVFNADGTTFPADAEHEGLKKYIDAHGELFNQPGIFFAEYSEVFFSAPIARDDGSKSILLGTHSNVTLQHMLQNVDFKNQGLCCIVDSDGTVVVSATDETPFLQLNDIFGESASADDRAEAQRLLEDIGAHRSGVAEFNNVGGESILLGYDFLEINDWMLLTLVTADLFSDDTMPYIVNYMVIIGFLLLALLAIVFIVIWYYRRLLRQIKTIALTDPLTGGCNELAFRLKCADMLREQPEREYAIVYANVRNFKEFNERFGVRRGDELLRRIFAELRGRLGERELVSRASGDHFYLLLECPEDGMLKARLRDMFGGMGRHLLELFPTANIAFDQGAYHIKDRDADLMIISNRAKVASGYQKGGDCRFYDDELSGQIEREQMLDASFTHGIEHREFKLYIQPKVSSDGRKVCGGEVLTRWQHPEFGLLFPGDFIPLFERNGRICGLDMHIFEENCMLLKGWLAEGRSLPLSVNVSRAHLISGDFAFLDEFARIKAQYGIPDGLIELELTESLMLERSDVHMVTTMIDRAREMGFLCSIDDFGFGYSSLTMLKDMNVNAVKLDRQFFLDESEKSWMVVGQIIQLTHNLGMSVVAEGIEDERQVEKLRSLGCDCIQGYVYSKPLPIADFEAWSARR